MNDLQWWRQQIITIRGNLAALDRILPQIITATTLTEDDAWPGPGQRGPSNSISDPTGAAVIRREDLTELATRIRLTMTILTEASGSTLAAGRALAARYTLPEDKVLCAASIAYEGYATWGKRDAAKGAPIACTELPAAGRQGLCVSCWMRRYRWQKDQ